MTRLFRSKSCGLVEFNSVSVPPPTPFFTRNDSDEDDDDDEDEEYKYEDSEDGSTNPLSTPFISPGSRFGGRGGSDVRGRHGNNQFAILDILVATLRKSLVTCSVDREDVSSMDISWPTDVRHVSHVTFDRFNGFLGLPTEFEPEVPRKVPSASVSVFGVSAKSMQCSYDDKGNSVPTILLMMQRRLYVEGGLKAEGIFRINAENSQEESVRDQLNKGVVPREIDVHCLAGLIKAWFRELPSGVLDSLTPEQVMKCNAEDDCTQLVKLLPPTESALLQWGINLMADVVEHEQYNKMNARNIAMVFAPNMTQMADPLTALIHAVQVMNLLKTLIMKTLRERDEAAAKIRLHNANSVSPTDEKEPFQSDLNTISSGHACTADIPTSGEFLRSATMNGLEHNAEKCHSDFQKKHDGEDEVTSISDSNRHPSSETEAVENGSKDEYDSGDWLSLKKGVRRLCRHPVFQLSKPAKKTQSLETVNNRSGGDGGAEETWV